MTDHEKAKAADIIADLFVTAVQNKIANGYCDLYVWEQRALDWLREWRQSDPDSPINDWTQSYLDHGLPPWPRDLS